MKVAVLSSIAWRTPPRQYGPWEQVASNIAEGLVKKGIDVTLFASTDSITEGKLDGVCPVPYAEEGGGDAKVWECLHISHLMEQAAEFDIIHNNFDFLPLTYSRLISTPMVTTIHGFSSLQILPVYQKYNDIGHYVSISYADRSPLLRYASNVYNGIDTREFSFSSKHGDYLLYFGRIHPHKGTYESIRIAKKAKMKLIIAGLIQDEGYFKEKIEPEINGEDIVYVGNASPNERDPLLGGAHTLLHPISFDEPFGLSVAESMICGTPVIAFNRGSMPELIRNNQTGFLVDTVDEAVEKLSEVPSLSRRKTSEWAKNSFGLEQMINGYLDVYQKIM